MLEAVIFDLDGVVVNTVPIHFAAWKKMFAEYDHDLTFEEYQEKVDGIPRTDGAKAILVNLSDEDIVIASDKKQKYFLETLEKEEIPQHEDAINLIHKLKTNHIPRAVISSSKNCKTILKRIGLYNDLEAVVTGNDITIGKPNPQIFEMAASKLNVKPQNSVVCEDAILGVAAAKNGKFKCVGIDRYSNPKRLSEADIVINSFNNISIKDLENLIKE